MFYLHVCPYTIFGPCTRRLEESVRFPGTGISDAFILQCGCWKSSPGPLEGKPGLLALRYLFNPRCPFLRVLEQHAVNLSLSDFPSFWILRAKYLFLMSFENVVLVMLPLNSKKVDWALAEMSKTAFVRKWVRQHLSGVCPGPLGYEGFSIAFLAL